VKNQKKRYDERLKKKRIEGRIFGTGTTLPGYEPSELNQIKKMEIFANTGIKWNESEGALPRQTVNITKLTT
jgi:hypothetical protein